MTIRIASPDHLPEAVGRSASGDWLVIDQERVNRFADVSEDHQWIHVDPERAAAGPFGTPVAHGYLTLSLVPRLTEGLLRVGGVGLMINYGLERVRFVTPVAVGRRVRATTTIASAEVSSRGTRVTSDVVVEIEEADKPALVARTIALVVPAS
jgi:acyl dehydratase